MSRFTYYTISGTEISFLASMLGPGCFFVGFGLPVLCYSSNAPILVTCGLGIVGMGVYLIVGAASIWKLIRSEHKEPTQ